MLPQVCSTAVIAGVDPAVRANLTRVSQATRKSALYPFLLTDGRKFERKSLVNTPKAQVSTKGGYCMFEIGDAWLGLTSEQFIKVIIYIRLAERLRSLA